MKMIRGLVSLVAQRAAPAARVDRRARQEAKMMMIRVGGHTRAGRVRAEASLDQNLNRGGRHRASEVVARMATIPPRLGSN